MADTIKAETPSPTPDALAPGAVGAAPGDALIGQVVASGSAVTAVTPATKIFGMVSVAVSAPGNFTAPHILGRAPLGVVIQMTAAGAMWFQPSMFDEINLYMVACAPGLTAKVQVWLRHGISCQRELLG